MAQLRILGGSLGITASTVFVQTQVSKYLKGVILTRDSAKSGSLESGLSGEQMQTVRQAYSKAFQLGMATATGVSGAAVLIAFFAYQRKRTTIQEKRRILAEEETARRKAQNSPRVSGGAAA